MEIKYVLKLLVCCLLFSSVVGCGGGGDSSTESTDDIAQSPPSTPSTDPVSALFNLIIPVAVAAEMPTGATATVNIQGQGVNLTKNIDDTAQTVAFNDLLVGDYRVSVIVNYEGTEVGNFTDNITLTSSGLSVEANVQFNRASLVIEPIVGSDYSFLIGEYEGDFVMISGCLVTPFNPSPTKATVSLINDDISIKMEIFPDPNIILTGVIDDSSGQLMASGTYQSSDFTSGTWTIKNILKPSNHSIFFDVEMINQTNDNCSTAIEYVGFKIR